MAAAVDAERAVTYADRSNDEFQRMAQAHDAYRRPAQAGRVADAEARFREAEQMQAELQPELLRCCIRWQGSSIATCSSPSPSAPRGRKV